MPEETSRQIKILIVDDEEAVADILKDFLSYKERSIDVCYDGVAGIESIQKNFYDLIIVDLVMPKVGGLDILRYAKKTNPDVLVIIITGHASLETAVMAIKEGAYDYIRKPCKLEEIRIVVENAIDKIKLYRENRELIKKLQDAYNELMAYKQERNDNKKNANINFFSSDTPSLHYLYNNSSFANNYIEKLQALSFLKDSGNLTEDEFKTFKRNLLKMIDHEQ
ncbi:MAG: response regulator [Thermodesulfobacteriota bacterium]|nr:response regulator [Thermodesulfobacteriota bacterium]